MFDLNIENWSFERNVRHRIDELKVLADESDRKAAIAKELERTQLQVQRQFENIINQYT